MLLLISLQDYPTSYGRVDHSGELLTNPQVLLQRCLTADFGFDLKARTATLFDDGNTPFVVSKLSTIAAFVVGVLRNPDRARNRYLYVRSAITTQRSILEALEDITKEKWTVKYVKAEDKKQQGLSRIEAGDFMGNLDLIEAAIVTPGTGFDFQGTNQEFGIPGDEDIRTLVEQTLLEKDDSE